MSDDRDVVARSYELDRQILAIPEDRVFTKRTVVAGFVVIFACLVLLMAMVLNVTRSTNDAVEHEIPGLKAQIADRDQTIDGATSAITQLTDALLASQQQVRDLGGTPADVTVRTDETPTDG